MAGSFDRWLARRRSQSASAVTIPQQPKPTMSTTISPRSTTTAQFPSSTSAYLPPPQAQATTHSPIADSFLDAKAQNARRMSGYDAARGTWSPGSSSTPQASLTAVMESTPGAPSSGQNNALRPPSAYKAGEKRTSSRSGNDGGSKNRRSGAAEPEEGMLTMDKRRSSEKGKGREISAGGLGGIPEEPLGASAPWVLDPIEMELGSWSTGSRVILILGYPTVESLEPLLSNPAFANTFVLIGSFKPIPAIEELLSPSHLMSHAPDREIYPTLHTFQASIGKDDTEAHAFTILLDKAASLAKQFRARSPPPSHSRHASFDSTNSNSSNASLGMRTKVMSGLGISTGPSRRASYGEGNLSRPTSTTSVPNLPKTMSTQSLRSDTSRRSSRNRLSSAFSGMIRSDSEAKAAPHLFDAVINFIPSTGSKGSLRDLIHQASVVTTGVLPLLALVLGKSSTDDTSVLPVTLLHVLPSRSPAALPGVLEMFVLSLLPNFQGRCVRDLFGCAVPLSVWRAPLVNMSSNVLPDVSVSGAEVLLAGGVRCPTTVAATPGGKMKGRVYLPSWDCCMTMAGVIGESRRPSAGSSRSGSRSVSRQPSPGDSSSNEQLAALPLPPPVTSPISTLGPIPVSPRTSMLSPPLSPSQPKRRSMLSTVAAAADPPVSPPTPDLDPSASSCSSSFALGETNSQNSNNAAPIAPDEITPHSSGGLPTAEQLAVPKGGKEGDMKKRGSMLNMAGWLKRRTKSALA
ncbi:hypothetical protein IAR50_004070 [Cryptococcus sp. DSM 104548]